MPGQATLSDLTGDEDDAVDDEGTPVEEDDAQDTGPDEPRETPTADETEGATDDPEADEPDTDLWGNAYDDGTLLDDEEDEEEGYYPTSPGGPWDCPSCGPGASECCYRCSECKKDLASSSGGSATKAQEEAE